MTDLLLQRVPSVRAKSNSTSRSSKPQASSLKRRQSGKVSPQSSLARAVKGVNSYVHYLRDGLTDEEREEQRKLEERKQILALRMKNAETLQAWEEAAAQLDKLEGNDSWKEDAATGDYNPELVEACLAELDDARIGCDVARMMHLVRTSLSRDLGGMGNIDLYKHSYVGTKRLIERYVDSTIKTIDSLVDKSAMALPDGVEHQDLLESILLARQSFGRSALLLSGGATFGMTHIGVLKAMWEAKLMPRIISGASAGSIVCSVLCTRTDDEMPQLLAEFPYGDLDVFEDPLADQSLLGRLGNLRRLLTEGSWLDISHLIRVMRNMLGDITFQEAYNRTRRICNITVSSASVYELPRLLNYITAPNVMIWSAVAASCSVPVVFSAAPLLVKDPITGAHIPWNPMPQRWIDGSVDNDLPMTRLAEMFNVNHFIVSQVNPHIVPFLSKEDPLHEPHKNNKTHPTPSARSSLELPIQEGGWIHALTSLAKDEAIHRLQFLAELGIFPNIATKLRSVLAQKYSGDINILPKMSLNDFPKVLRNPDTAFMLRVCLVGERATWPKLSRIRDRCAIELALDRAVHDLRARVVFSKSQVDLRRMATGSGNYNIGPGGLMGGMGGRISIAIPDSQGYNSLAYSPDKVRHRQRRGSGSSIPILARHRGMLLNGEGMLTDADTEEEELLELSQRRGGPALSLGLGLNRGGSKSTSRLKRAARSHVHIPFAQGPLTGPAPMSSMDDALSFDFSKPMSPPNDSAIQLDEPAPRNTEEESDGADTPEAPQRHSSALAPEIGITSPTEVFSDPHTSDGDVDSRTGNESDESLSDPEPYDGNWLLGDRSPAHGMPAADRAPAKMDELFVQARQEREAEIGGGLWD